MNITNIAKTARWFLGNYKTQAVFKKAASAVRKASSIEAMKKDVGVRFVKAMFYDAPRFAISKVGAGAGWAWNKIPKGRRQLVQKTTKIAGNAGKTTTKKVLPKAKIAGKAFTKKVLPTALLGVGAVGMLSIGIMNGINNASKDIVLERYMADQRFSRDILLQSRVGLSMGTNQMNRMGSTIGLSNALSRTRHGARY